MNQTTFARRVFLTVFSLAVVYLVRDFLVPVATGGIFALVLYPMMDWKRARKLSENARSLIITTLFMLIILLPAGLLVAVGANRALGFVGFVQDRLQGGDDAASTGGFLETIGMSKWLNWVNQWVPVSEEQFRDVFLKGAKSAGVFVSAVLTNFLGDLPGFLVTCFVIVVAVFFFLRDGKKIVRFIKRHSVYNDEDTNTLLKSTDELCKSSVNATIATGIAQAAVIVLSAVICGISVSSLALIGLTAFISSFIPLVGIAPLMLGLTAYGFVTGPPWHGVMFLIFLVISGLTDNVVRPLVLGGGGR